MALPREAVGKLLEQALESTGGHPDALSTFDRHFRLGAQQLPQLPVLEGHERATLIGAYLTQCYAYEGVALTNPSIVRFKDPMDGRQGFVMSARAIGEGHISSIAFITGEVTARGEVSVDTRPRFPTNGDQAEVAYEFSGGGWRSLTSVAI